MLLTEKEEKPELLKQNLEELEFQVFRMQENLKEIAKKWQVIGIEQAKEEKWVIVYLLDDGHSCKIMLNDCETAFRGMWDFSIQAKYEDIHTIHIGDIKGEPNKGYGSILHKLFKKPCDATKHSVYQRRYCKKRLGTSKQTQPFL